MLTENPRTEGTRASVHRECECPNRKLAGDDSQHPATTTQRGTESLAEQIDKHALTVQGLMYRVRALMHAVDGATEELVPDEDQRRVEVVDRICCFAEIALEISKQATGVAEQIEILSGSLKRGAAA